MRRSTSQLPRRRAGRGVGQCTTSRDLTILSLSRVVALYRPEWNPKRATSMAARSHPTILALDGNPAPMDQAGRSTHFWLESLRGRRSVVRRRTCASASSSSQSASLPRTVARRTARFDHAIAIDLSHAGRPIGAIDPQRLDFGSIFDQRDFFRISAVGSGMHSRGNGVCPIAPLGRHIEKSDP